MRSRRIRLNVELLEARIVPALLGQQLFPTNNAWNQNISTARVAANSAAVIAHIGASIGVHPDWGNDSTLNGNDPLYGIPLNIVHGNSTTKVNVSVDKYPKESDIVPVPIPANAVLEGDYQNGPNLNGGGGHDGQRGDSHLIIWDEDNNVAYELFGATRPADPTLFPDVNDVEQPHTDGMWHAAQETVWNMKTNTFRTIGNTSADAAGLSILAGLTRPDEGLPTSQGGQGAINHALRVTLSPGDINQQFTYPASHLVYESRSPDALPMGARLRLENTPAVNALIAKMGPEAQIIARAMQQYGLILADVGGPMYVSGTSASVNANNAITLVWNMDDVLGLEALKVADFQVLDLTPRVTGVSTSMGAAGESIIITGQNFSGAAGRLYVFFGNTPTAAVTYISDTQLQVIVPPGAGTVALRVQSGITIPTDHDNAEDTIFGYGLSAVTSKATFTYLSPHRRGL